MNHMNAGACLHWRCNALSQVVAQYLFCATLLARFVLQQWPPDFSPTWNLNFTYASTMRREAIKQRCLLEGIPDTASAQAKCCWTGRISCMLSPASIKAVDIIFHVRLVFACLEVLSWPCNHVCCAVKVSACQACTARYPQIEESLNTSI